MQAHQFIMSGTVTLSLLAFGAVQAAEEGSKPSAAARQASKARDYANRADKEGPADVAAASSAAAAGQKEGDKTPLLDSPVIDKAAKDAGDNWKKMDRALDRF